MFLLKEILLSLNVDQTKNLTTVYKRSIYLMGVSQTD